jgi:hypothetical protein
MTSGIIAGPEGDAEGEAQLENMPTPSGGDTILG